ncbi:DDE-type integrase/transposase/recombinase [Clostridium perfringens]|nr:DDE-type integrase/transposase/recombinase [Clostridium perfringens]
MSKDNKIIFHSDLGSQYTSNDMKNLCNEFNIIQSFSQKGCPYDNACIVISCCFKKKKKFIEILMKSMKMLKINFSIYRKFLQ